MTTSVVRPFRGVSAEQRRAQRREALLEAGMTVIASAGISGATIEAISAEAALSKRYFYEQFRSRDGLVGVLVAQLIEQILAGAIESIRAQHDLDGRLRAASTRVVTFLSEDPRRARLFVDAMGNAQLHDEVGRAEHTLARLIVDEIGRDVEISEQQRSRHYVVTVILVTGTAQAVVDWLDGTSELTLDELVDTVANLSTAAIRTVQPDL